MILAVRRQRPLRHVGEGPSSRSRGFPHQPVCHTRAPTIVTRYGSSTEIARRTSPAAAQLGLTHKRPMQTADARGR